MSTESFNKIKSWLPWIQSPLVVNAPMGGFAGPVLAAEVTKAGGLGQIGSMSKPQKVEQQFEKTRKTFKNHDFYKDTGMLPIGIGFLMYMGELKTLLPVLKEYKPAVCWLFAARELEDYTTWTQAIREAHPKVKVIIQCGSVKNALLIGKNTKPDILSIQGHDAGGHGYEVGAGVITLLPEVADAFKANDLTNIPLLAAGGIADGRGVAAALSLGAAGVVMGTRFLSAPEAKVHSQYRDKVIKTQDGGQMTVKTKVFDEYHGENQWPHRFDSRGLITPAYMEHAGAVELDKLRDLHGEGSIFQPDEQFDKPYAVLWMGTAVGLVTCLQGAKEIVREVREGAKVALQGATAHAEL